MSSATSLLPARAGMVPSAAAEAHGPWAAPRTRGDGPDRCGERGQEPVCSPHARGWSPVAPGATPSGSLLPARAGMVPARSASATWRVAAPRTRGDGPSTGKTTSKRPPCSPHARGWSLPGVVLHVRGVLLPARAGMVPPSGRFSARSMTAPRTRGDGPEYRDAVAKNDLCSPHARGWSHPRRPRRLTSALLPARAGMVPAPRRGCRSVHAAPRACGDGPESASPAGAVPDCSPRMRGWPRRFLQQELTEGLLPARTGMAPSPRSGSAP